MLLERNRLVVGLVFAAAVAVGTVWAVLLSAGLLVTGDEVIVELADADGLEPGNDVLVAGVRAGSLTSVEIVGDRIEVVIRTTAELPADSEAAVATKNALGARALRIVPGREWATLLTDLDDPRIPLERTRVSVDLPDLGDATVAVLEDADAASVGQLVGALADVTEDQGEQLDELLDGVQRVSRIVDGRRDELATFLADAGTLVDVLNDVDADLLRTIDEVGGAVAGLAERRQELVDLVRATPAFAGRAADLLTEERDRIDRSLDEVAGILAILDDHQIDVAHAIAYGGVAFEGFASVGNSAGVPNPYWGNVMTSSAGPIGTEAMGSCGGLVDQVLDALLGPGPECTGDEASWVGRDDEPRDVLGLRREPHPVLPVLPLIPEHVEPMMEDGQRALERFLGGALLPLLEGGP